MVVSKKIALFFYCKFEFDLWRVNYVTKGLGNFCFDHTNKTHSIVKVILLRITVKLNLKKIKHLAK